MLMLNMTKIRFSDYKVRVILQSMQENNERSKQ